MKNIAIFLILVLVLINSFSMYAQDTLRAEKFGIYPDKQKFINRDIDLRGGVLSIPDGVVLNFKGGLIKNGTLIGNNTQIICKKQAFDNITVKGVWNVPIIYSTWFKELSSENALKNVLALTNPTIKNKVIIGEGKYIVQVNKEGESCLSVGNNTEIELNGDVYLKPNQFKTYYIWFIGGENVKLSGRGTIVGDKHTHTGKTGEWGMGIMVSGANNVRLSQLTIKDCWGDCIYIGGNSKNVIVEDCNLIHGRRQGISVTSGNDIVLRNLTISDVGGTNPEYAIDIEPNANGIVGDVWIENVTVQNCKGGFLVYGDAINASVGKVIISKNTIINTSKVPIVIRNCNSAEINNNVITAFASNNAINCMKVNNLEVVKNRIKIKEDLPEKLKSNLLMNDYIRIANCKKVQKNKNIEFDE